MPVVAVVNRKGGSGKSTLSTNIAAWCAHSGWQVMLGDIDRQQSVRSWLQRRPTAAPPITTWAVDNGRVFRAPRGTTHVVLDTPGALYDFEQSKLLVWLDAIVVPIGPSLFDREASLTFLTELQRHPRVRTGKCKIAPIGMRWPPEALEQWKRGEGTWQQSLLTVIPEDPRYRAFLDSGSSVFDEFGAMTPQDRVHWSPLLHWLDTIWTKAQLPAEQSMPPVVRQTEKQGNTVNTSRKPPSEGQTSDRALPCPMAEANKGQEMDAVPTEQSIPAYLLRSEARGEATRTTAASNEATVIDHSKPSADGLICEPCMVVANGATTSMAPGVGVTAETGTGTPTLSGDPAQAADVVAVTTATVSEQLAAQAEPVLSAAPPQKDKGWISRWFNLA